MCGMCPANGELENGDPEAPVDFLCRVAHLRAYTFGLPVVPHGDCEYCEDGQGYEDLMRSVASLKQMTPGRRIVAKNKTSQALLPMLGASPAGECSSGGCASCSVHP